MARYIDADALKDEIQGARVIKKPQFLNAEETLLIIDKQPTADVEEVKHGEWKHTVEKGTVFNHHFFTCSLCGASAFTSGYEKYCHECGAKMRGEKNDL